MKKFITLSILLSITGVAVFVSCSDKTANTENADETMTSGSLSLQVDNTAQPIVEDVLAVFQSVYINAKITQVNRNEADIINALLNGGTDVAVLSRTLTEGEEAHFAKAGIKPRVTAFAKDALALVASKSAADTIVNIEDIYKIMKGEEPSVPKQLVFDSATSSTVSFLMKKAGVDKIPLKNVYSLKNTTEVLTFVDKNPNAIGVIGVNWLVQPPQDLLQAIKNVRVLGVNNVKNGVAGKDYYKPSQSNIAAGSYPFSRTLYLLNYQGRNALGMGFANYLSAPDGQRIVLKSGLVPVTIPPREIEIINE